MILRQLVILYTEKLLIILSIYCVEFGSTDPARVNLTYTYFIHCNMSKHWQNTTILNNF